MSTYIVIYEGTVREQYIVEADSPEHARQIWSDFDAVSSEVIDGEVTDVWEDEE